MINKKLEKIAFTLFVFTILISFYIYGMVVRLNGDNIEHMHTSWLIWQGNVPYRDFFQHHNPLIWYIFAPVVAFFIDNIVIFRLFSLISVIALCFVVFYQAKIIKQLNVSKFIVLLFASTALSSYSILLSTDYRPDTFMYLFFFSGLYYLFEYINNAKSKSLILSFLLFFLSFLCTQKVVLNFLILAPFILYLLYKNKISKDDFVKSCFLPIVISICFISYLYVNDSLLIYWKSCYLFNSKLADFFVETRFTMPPMEYYDIYIFSMFGIFSAIYFFIKGNIKERIIVSLFLEELLARLFYFSAFLHYNTMLLMLAIMLSFLALNRIKIGNNIKMIVLFAYIIFSNVYNYQKTYINEVNNKNINIYEYYFNNLTPCDYAINGYYAVNNLQAKDVGYYHILLGQLDVLGERLGIAPKDDLNKLIETHLPKIISNDIYWDMYLRERGRMYPSYVVNYDIVSTYYQHSGIGNIYILKPQYQKKYCKKNNGIWEYVD